MVFLPATFVSVRLILLLTPPIPLLIFSEYLWHERGCDKHWYPRYHWLLRCIRSLPHSCYCLDHHGVPEQVFIPSRNQLYQAIGMAYVYHRHDHAETPTSSKKTCAWLFSWWPARFLISVTIYFFISMGLTTYILQTLTMHDTDNGYPDLLCPPLRDLMTDKLTRTKNWYINQRKFMPSSSIL